MATRRRRRWRWSVLGLLVSWSCVGVQRPTTLTVGGDVSMGQAKRILTGCDGEVLSREVYRQASVSAHARYEHASGGIVMARLRGVSGALIEASGDDPQPPPSALPRRYGLLGFGLAGGFDWRHAGVDLGGTLIATDALVDAWPYAQLRLGALDSVWLATTLGSMDATFHARLLGLGIGARGERFRLYGGVAGTTMIVDTGAEHRDDLSLTDAALGAELDLQVLPFDSNALSVDLSAVLSQNLAAKLGMSWRF